MSFDAKLIVRSQAILDGRRISSSEAEAKAKRLWSREEYVATLFIGGGIFPSGSAIAEVLFASAMQRHVEPSTPRMPTTKDLAGAIDARRQARDALAALIVAYHADAEVANSTADGMRSLARREPVGPGHPGFRWRLER